MGERAGKYPYVFQHLYLSAYPRVPKSLKTVSKLIHECPLLKGEGGGVKACNGLLPRKVKIKKLICVSMISKSPKKERGRGNRNRACRLKAEEGSVGNAQQMSYVKRTT